MNESMSHDDFFAAFADEGYQSPAEEATEEVETETAETDTEEVQEEAETAEDGEAGEPETEEGDQEAAQQQEETFTIKVNKEERTVSRDEMITLAQKGADYDRVKASAEQAKSDNTALREQVAEMSEAFDLLKSLAEHSKCTVPELLDAFRVNRYKGDGMSEETARERVAKEKVERELNALKAQQQAAQNKPDTDRAKRDVEEFRKLYPDVQLTEELVDSLVEDVQAGMSLTQAYQKKEAARKDEEIRTLKAELEAEKKNRENRASSPGSQKDSGAKRVKTQFDAFFGAFND